MAFEATILPHMLSPIFAVIDDENIVYRDYVDISVAVATPKVVS